MRTLTTASPTQLEAKSGSGSAATRATAPAPVTGLTKSFGGGPWPGPEKRTRAPSGDHCGV